jgi:hypothetical protein
MSLAERLAEIAKSQTTVNGHLKKVLEAHLATVAVLRTAQILNAELDQMWQETTDEEVYPTTLAVREAIKAWLESEGCAVTVMTTEGNLRIVEATGLQISW